MCSTKIHSLPSSIFIFYLFIKMWVLTHLCHRSKSTTFLSPQISDTASQSGPLPPQERLLSGTSCRSFKETDRQTEERRTIQNVFSKKTQESSTLEVRFAFGRSGRQFSVFAAFMEGTLTADRGTHRRQ